MVISGPNFLRVSKPSAKTQEEPFDPFASGQAIEQPREEVFDPFASGQAIEDPTSNFDPFAAGLAEEDAESLRQRVYSPGSTYTPTKEEAKRIFDADRAQTFSEKAGRFAEGATSAVGDIGTQLAGAGKEILSGPTPAQVAVSGLEAAGRGTYDLMNLGRMAYNKLRDAAVEHPLRTLANPMLSVLAPNQEEDFDRWYERFLSNLAQSRQREKSVTGQENVLPEFITDRVQPLPHLSEVGSYVLDPTLPISFGTSTTAKLGSRVASQAASKGGKAVEVAGRTLKEAGELPERIIHAGVEKLVGPEMADQAQKVASLGGVASVPAALAGVGGPMTALPAAAKVAQAKGAALEKAGQMTSRLADLPGDSQTPRLLQLARDREAPLWMRTVALGMHRTGVGKAAAGVADYTGAAATGAAIGGTLGALTAENPEELGAAVGTGVALGTAGRAAASPLVKRARILEAKAGDLRRFYEKQRSFGVSDDFLRQHVGDEVMLAAATLDGVFEGQLDIRFVDAKTFVETGGRPGTSGHFDPGSKQILINAEAQGRKPTDTFYHELGHALAAAQVADNAQIKTVIDGLLGSPERLQEAKRQYADALIRAEKNAGGTPPSVEAKIAELDAQSQQNHGDPNHWVYGEIYAEAVLRSLTGKDVMSDIVNSETLRQQGVRWGKDFLTALGVKFDERPSAAADKPASIFAKFDDVIDSPELRKLTYRYIRERNNFISGVSKPAEKGTAVTREMHGKHAGVPFEKKSDGTTGNDFAYQTNDGVTHLRTRAETRKIESERAKEVEQGVAKLEKDPSMAVSADAAGSAPNAVDDFVKPRRTISGRMLVHGKRLGQWFYNLKTFGAEAKSNAKTIEGAINNGDVLNIWYQAASAGSGGEYVQNFKKLRGGVAVSNRDVVPFTIVVSRSGDETVTGGRTVRRGGNILVNALDLTTAERKALDWQARNKLDLWGGDVAAFREDLFTYLRNHADGQPGEASGIGVEKKNVLNAFVLGDNRAHSRANPLRDTLSGADKVGIIRSFRLDRTTSVKPTGRTVGAAEYNRKVLNQSPEGAAPEGRQFSPDLQLAGKPLPNSVEGPLKLIHFSSNARLKNVSPKFFGRGDATPADRRGGNKSYFFVEGSDLGQDENIFSRKTMYGAAIDGSRIYDVSKGDPLRWASTLNREEADDILRSKGYAGLRVRTVDGREVVALFKPVTVEPVGEGFGAGRAVRPFADKQISKFAQKAFELTLSDGGTTYNLVGDKPMGGEKAYAVSIYPDRSLIVKGNPTKDQITEFIRQNQDLLSRADHSLGTWFDKSSGQTYVDVSVTVPERDWAEFLGREYNQKAIFDLNKFEEIKTGGTGKPKPNLPAPTQRVPAAKKKFDEKKSGGRRVYSPELEAKLQKRPNPQIRKEAEDYARSLRIKYTPHEIPEPVREDLGKRVADAYEAAQHRPDDPAVKAAYDAFARETIDQWQFLVNRGVKMEPWTQEGQPYRSSAEMVQDVVENRHLWFFPTEAGYGQSGTEGMNHPLLQKTGIEVGGIELVVNDLFRAVHDYFGHAKEGFEFGPKGEYNAFLAHSRMFSDEAVPAMAAETMGQNSWVNFGKHLRDASGNIPKKGEPGYVPVTERPYADQKATLLPADLLNEARSLKEAVSRNGERAVSSEQKQSSPDTAYLDAVGRGDTETARRMVEEAARESGLPILDDSASTAYRIRRTTPPKKTVKAYKLFRAENGRLFPLFVSAKDPIPRGVWLDALPGPESKSGKVKSKLGDLAYRPGWHAGDIPLATHIGIKNAEGKVFARRGNEVWAEVEVSADRDYQPEARANGQSASGKFRPAFADIKRMPADGMYRYKTNPNMTGEWIISGSMKIGRILGQKEVDAILKKSGATPMPWEGGALELAKLGLKEGESIDNAKLLDAVTYDDEGRVIPLSERFQSSISDVRYSPDARSEEALKVGLAQDTDISPTDEAAIPVRVVVNKDGKPVLDREGKPKYLPVSYDFLYTSIVEDIIGKEADPEAAKKLLYGRKGIITLLNTSKLTDRKQLTPEQQALYSKIVDRFGNEFEKEYSRIKSDPDVVAAKGWYKEVAAFLKTKIKDQTDRQMFLEFLGGTSPNTSVEQNFLYAMDLFNRWKTGELKPFQDRYNEAVQKLSDGTLRQEMLADDGTIKNDLLLEFRRKLISDYGIAPKHALKQFRKLFRKKGVGDSDLFGVYTILNDAVPIRKNQGKYGVHTDRVIAILNRTWTDDSDAPKAINFTGNLAGTSILATIDVWAARFLRRLGSILSKDRWRIQPLSEEGVGNADFFFGQDVFNRASELIKDRHGEALDPDDLQAIMWFAEKRVWAERGWAKEEDLGDFRQYLYKMEEDERGTFKLSDPVLNKTSPDFLQSLKLKVERGQLTSYEKQLAEKLFDTTSRATRMEKSIQAIEEMFENRKREIQNSGVNDKVKKVRLESIKKKFGDRISRASERRESIQKALQEMYREFSVPYNQ